MRALFIGGTGNISSASSMLALARGWELYILNRGTRQVDLAGARTLVADIRNAGDAARAIGDMHFDVVVNWIAYTERDVARDIQLFSGKISQYVFISSASAYQKPPSHPVITESTPLANSYWDYSRGKIACENFLMDEYRNSGFPVTIVRPSLTYDTVIPAAIGSWDDYTLVDRMKRGLPTIVHGDGTSLWTITHADDFAIGFVGLMAHQQAIGHSFHITSDEVLTWNQIYTAMSDAAGVKPYLIHIPSDFIADVADAIGQHSVRGCLLGDKTHSVIFDNTKIKTFVPEYRATIPFSQGIRRTLAWFEADPRRKTIIPANQALLDSVLKRWDGLTIENTKIEE